MLQLAAAEGRRRASKLQLGGFGMRKDTEDIVHIACELVG